MTDYEIATLGPIRFLWLKDNIKVAGFNELWKGYYMRISKKRWYYLLEAGGHMMRIRYKYQLERLEEFK